MKAEDVHNLMSDYELPADSKNESEPEDLNYYPHLKREFYLNLIYDDS